jgi:putative phage-type endonuclease
MQGTIEWLKERQKGIGGSDVAAILGLNEFSTALDVYEQKIAENPVEIEENPKMKAGKRMEATIAKWYAEENNRKVQRRNDIIWHKTIPYLFVSLDRMIVMQDEMTPGILECKNTTSLYFKSWDPLSDYVMMQVQHQLDVTGWAWAVVAVLVDGWDFRLIPVEPDPKLIAEKNKILANFWTNNVLKRIPPEPMSESDIKKLYPEIKQGEVLEVTEDAYRLSRYLLDVKAVIKESEEKEKKLSTALKLILLDKEIATYQNKVIFTWKQQKSHEGIDKSALENLYPDAYEACKITVPGNRLLLPKGGKM